MSSPERAVEVEHPISDPPQGRTLRHSFAWSLCGNVSYAATQWGVLVALSRLGTPEVLGLFGLGLALTGPFYAFFNLNIRDLLVTDVTRQYEHREYFQCRLVTSAIALFLIALLGFFYQEPTTIFLIGLAKCCEAVSDLYEAILQKYDRLDLVAKAQLFNGVFGLSGVLILMFVWHSFFGALLVLLVARALTLSWNMRRVALLYGEGQPKEVFAGQWRWNKLFRLMRQSLPLGILILLVALNTYASRFVLAKYHGIEALGVYTALNYFMYAGVTVCQALSQAAAPRLARLHQQPGKAFNILLTKLVLFATTIGLGGAMFSYLFGDWLLSLVYGPRFDGSAPVLTVLMLAATAMYIYGYLSVALTIMRRLNLQAVIAAAAVIMNVGAAFLFVPAYGSLGAAMAVLIGSATYLLTSAYVITRAPAPGHAEKASAYCGS